MTKKVLIISSSPRKGANSDTLCDQFYVGAIDAGHSAEKIFLCDKKINYCKGCNCCIDNGYCCQNDDVAEILVKMINADVIVLATPVYFYTMSAQLKTLIDRCYAKYTKISDKEFYLLITAADNSIDKLKRISDEINGFLSCLNKPTLKGTLVATGVFRGGDIYGTEFHKKAYEMGNLV